MKISKDNIGSSFDCACPQCGHDLMFLDWDGDRSWWAQCDNHATCNLSIDLEEDDEVTGEDLKRLYELQ